MGAPDALHSASVARPLTSYSNNAHHQWWHDPGLRKLNLMFVIIFMSPLMIGFDGSLINGLLAIPQCMFDSSISISCVVFVAKPLSGLQDIGLPNTNQLGLIIASQSFGGLIGFLPASLAMDRFGRRKAAMFGDVCVVCAGEPASIPQLTLVAKSDNYVYLAIGQSFTQSWSAYMGCRIVVSDDMHQLRRPFHTRPH